MKRHLPLIMTLLATVPLLSAIQRDGGQKETSAPVKPHVAVAPEAVAWGLRRPVFRKERRRKSSLGSRLSSLLSSRATLPNEVPSIVFASSVRTVSVWRRIGIPPTST